MAKTFLPSGDFEQMLDLSKFLEGAQAPVALLGPDGQMVGIPESVYKVLVDIVEAMRAGKAVTVVPQSQMLTTQQAADFLGVSRPTLVKLLESGQLAFTRPAGGRHRRISLNDLLDYEQNHRVETRASLKQMTEDAYKAGLYEESVEDYEQALKRVRTRS